MPVAANKVRFHPSWRYMAIQTVAILVVWFLIWLVVDPSASVARFVAYGVIVVTVTVFRILTDMTVIDDLAIRGVSSTTGTWSTKPPHLDDVEDIETSTRGLARVVTIAATDGHGDRREWRLDAPRALRWGPDRAFDAEVTRLRQLWDEAASSRAS